MLRQSEIGRDSKQIAGAANKKLGKSPEATFIKIDRIVARKRFLEGSEIILAPSLMSPSDELRAKTISLNSPNPDKFIGKVFFNWLVDQSGIRMLNTQNGNAMRFYLKR